MDSQKILTFLQSIDCKQFYIAFSGGVDSCVLLHLISRLKLSATSFDQKIHAIYVNHNLSLSSSQWGDFCQSVCNQYHIPLTICSVQAQPQKRQSPESAARDARYSGFSSILKEDDCLLTAHHLNDQSETLLIQLLRGAGVKGLSGMAKISHSKLSSSKPSSLKPSSSKKSYLLARPLLESSKQEILDYAKENNIQWVEDESNAETRYRRNFLRHEVIPKLKTTWPQLDQTLYRASQHQAEAAQLLDEIAKEDLLLCTGKGITTVDEPALAVSPLIRLSDSRIKNCLQYWLGSNQIPLLNSNLLGQFLIKLRPKKNDDPYINRQLIRWVGNDRFNSKVKCYELNIYRGILYLHKVYHPEHSGAWVDIEFDPFAQPRSQKLAVGKLDVYLDQNRQKKKHAIKSSRIKVIKIKDLSYVTISYRKGGELFKKTEASQHFQLKKWFQEQGIPEWKRDELPLFYSGSNLFQVANQVINKSFLATDEDEGVSFEFTYDC